MAVENARPWPEWTAITTDWNGPYDEPDPDEYHADCYRCQEAGRTPHHFDGRLADCIEWAYGHENDREVA